MPKGIYPTNKYKSPETLEKIKVGNLGKKHSEETIAKMQKAHKAKKFKK